jgi:hypothetical protein
MSNLLVLLVLVVTIFLSGLFSPVSGQEDEFQSYSLLAWYGDNGSPNELSVAGAKPVPPSSVLVLPPPSFEAQPILFCLTTPSQTCLFSPGPQGASSILPPDTQLKSTNSDVASVEDSQDRPLGIYFKGFGSTILQVLRNGILQASYGLIFSPFPPGRRCLADDIPAVVDCSGKCVDFSEVLKRLGDMNCDDGSQRDHETQPIDLSCASFIPELLLTASLRPFSINNPSDFGSPELLEHLERLPNPRDLDGGDCSLKESCTVQFGPPPGFEFCSALSNSGATNAGVSVCSFNAITGKGRSTGGGRCAATCQRFGSHCLAALDSDPPDCTPRSQSRDTYKTPRQTASCICTCERR